MPATHVRYTADIPLSKERRIGTVMKALDPAAKAWQEAVEKEGGMVEIDAVTVAKRKTPEPPPANPGKPTVDLASFAELGTAVDKAAGTHAPEPTAGTAPRHPRAAA